MNPAALNRILAEIRRAAPAISGLQVGAADWVRGHHFDHPSATPADEAIAE